MMHLDLLELRQRLILDSTQALEKIQAAHEATWIVDHVFKSLPPATLDWATSAEAEIKKIIARRIGHEPLAYILGEWAFRAHEYFVGPGVLIPRPETEELVDHLLNKSRQQLESHPSTLTLVDLGAGSGCIGLSWAIEVQREIQKRNLSTKLKVILVEQSKAAFFWLENNIERAKLSLGASAQIATFNGSWSEWPHESCDMVVANPPYLGADEMKGLDLSVRHFEPASALLPKDVLQFADASGPYREIIDIAEKILNAGGFLAFELGIKQPVWIQKFVGERNTFVDVTLAQDMAQKYRFLLATRKFSHG